MAISPAQVGRIRNIRFLAKCRIRPEQHPQFGPLGRRVTGWMNYLGVSCSVFRRGKIAGNTPANEPRIRVDHAGSEKGSANGIVQSQELSQMSTKLDQSPRLAHLLFAALILRASLVEGKEAIVFRYSLSPRPSRPGALPFRGR